MLSRSAAEIGTAAVTTALGLTVMASALEFGIGWGGSGPAPGAFPFFVGLLVTGASLGRAGWREVDWRDVTAHVAWTWDYCIRATEQVLVRSLLPFQPEPVRRFVAAFPAIRRAYAEGSMLYGLFRARR